MTFQSTNNLYGFPQALTRVFPAPILSQRVPQTTDYKYPIGQIWVDELGENSYILVYVAANVATWNLMSSEPGTLDTLTGDSGGAISPSAGNINLLGTASEITTPGAGSTITFSIPAATSVATAAGLWFGLKHIKYLKPWHTQIVAGATIAAIQSVVQTYAPNLLWRLDMDDHSRLGSSAPLVRQSGQSVLPTGYDGVALFATTP